jgi:hypothetical protein
MGRLIGVPSTQEREYKRRERRKKSYTQDRVQGRDLIGSCVAHVSLFLLSAEVSTPLLTYHHHLFFIPFPPSPYL